MSSLSPPVISARASTVTGSLFSFKASRRPISRAVRMAAWMWGFIKGSVTGAWTGWFLAGERTSNVIRQMVSAGFSNMLRDWKDSPTRR